MIFTFVFRVWVLSWDHGASLAPHPMSPSQACSLEEAGSQKEWKSGLNGHAVTSAAFYQSKQVTRPVHDEKIGKQILPLNGRSCKDFVPCEIYHRQLCSISMIQTPVTEITTQTFAETLYL